MKVLFGIASHRGVDRPECQPMLESLDATRRLLEANGHEFGISVVSENSYVQVARNTLVREFQRVEYDFLFFIDDDISWENPADALRLIEMPDDVVAGVYRKKIHSPEYPCIIHSGPDERPRMRADGCIPAQGVPAGFLRVKRSAFEKIRDSYPQYKYRDIDPSTGSYDYDLFDYFPQGVRAGRWVGEDFAFCNLWTGILGEIWIVPDISISHWRRGVPFRGNFHEFLLRQPGGSAQPFDLARADKIKGYMSVSELEWLAREAAGHECIVEIGSYYGRSTRAIADNMKNGGVIHALDDWKGPRDIISPQDTDIHGKFLENLRDHIDGGRVAPLLCDHAEADWNGNPAPDMVFIDGSHVYQDVKRDIQKWLPVLAPGGLLCGHDFPNFPGVERAVRELLPEAQQAPDTTIWFWRKTEVQAKA